MIEQKVTFPGLDVSRLEPGLIPLDASSDGVSRVGRNGVIAIAATGDRKVEFIAFRNHTLAYVSSALGYPAYYPVYPVRISRPLKGVLMDLE